MTTIRTTRAKRPSRALVVVAFAQAAALFAAGCTPPEELDGEELETTHGPAMRWDELMGGEPPQPIESGGNDDDAGFPSSSLRVPKLRAPTPRGADIPQTLPAVTAQSAAAMAALPSELRAEPRLARLALARQLEKPIAYEGGVFGLVGGAKMFVTTTDRIKDDARLYWVVVKVLSEKYGCFMVTKQNVGNAIRVQCRDRRRIVFWKSRGPGWIQFQSRQYDAEGYEIVVRNRRIVRVSEQRVL